LKCFTQACRQLPAGYFYVQKENRVSVHVRKRHSHPTKEHQMSATAVLRKVAVDNVVDLTPKQSFAALLVAKAKALAANPIAWLQKAWAAVVDTCHLATPIEYLRSWVATLHGYATKGAHYVGWAGGASLATASISTKTGRAILNNTVGHAVRGGGWLLRKGYAGITWGLRHLGKPGKGLADKMDAGCVKVALKTGEFYTKHVAKHVDLDSRAMRVTRDASIVAAIFQVGVLVTIPWLSTAIKVVSGLFGLASISEAVQSTDWYDREVKNHGVKVAPATDVKAELDVAEAKMDVIEEKLDTIEADGRELDQVTAEEAAIMREREDWTPEQWKAHNDANMATEEAVVEDVDPLEGPKAKLEAARIDNEAEINKLVAEIAAGGGRPSKQQQDAKTAAYRDRKFLLDLEELLYPEVVAEVEARKVAVQAEAEAKEAADVTRMEAAPAAIAAKQADLEARNGDKDPVSEALNLGNQIPTRAQRRKQPGRPARAGNRQG